MSSRNLPASLYCMTTFMTSDLTHTRSRIRVCKLFVKVMSIICAIFRRTHETCLTTRLAHARDSRELSRTMDWFFQERAHVLMYGKPYCIMCVFQYF